jgi:hypothetical protein
MEKRTATTVQMALASQTGCQVNVKTLCKYHTPVTNTVSKSNSILPRGSDSSRWKNGVVQF